MRKSIKINKRLSANVRLGRRGINLGAKYKLGRNKSVSISHNPLSKRTKIRGRSGKKKISASW